jgi:hypothetical protein
VHFQLKHWQTTLELYRHEEVQVKKKTNTVAQKRSRNREGTVSTPAVVLLVYYPARLI